MLGKVLLGLAVPVTMKLASHVFSSGGRPPWPGREPEPDEPPTMWERTITAVAPGEAPRCPKLYNEAVKTLKYVRRRDDMPCIERLFVGAVARAYSGPCKGAERVLRKAVQSCRARGANESRRRFRAAYGLR